IAVDTARANVAANGLSEIVRVSAGSVDSAEASDHYDLVVANIIARVIIELAPALVEKVRPGGTLVAGGIIASRADDVDRALLGLGQIVERHVDGDWITLVARN